MGDRLPPLLTVEEAAKLLRIGRTKAYALAREWRATGGRSGLPVVDFGHVLRVPVGKLEELTGTNLSTDPDTGDSYRTDTAQVPSVESLPRSQSPAPTAPLNPPTTTRSSRRGRHRHSESQPALFDSPPSTRR